MKLMRNVTPDGQCKYAAVRMDKLTALERPEQFLARGALAQLAALGLLENPRPGEREEFFLVKLKDRNSPEALLAYAAKAEPRDPELAADVRELAARAGVNSPWAKEPDTDPAAYGVMGLDAAAAVRDLDAVLAALVDVKPLAEYGVVGTYDTVQARRQRALAQAEQALLALRRKLSADGVPPSHEPSSDKAVAALVEIRRLTRKLLDEPEKWNGNAVLTRIFGLTVDGAAGVMAVDGGQQG